MFEKTAEKWSMEFDCQNNNIWQKKDVCMSCKRIFEDNDELYTLAGGGVWIKNSKYNSVSVSLYLPGSYVLYFCRNCFGEIAGEYWLLNSKEVL